MHKSFFELIGIDTSQQSSIHLDEHEVNIGSWILTVMTMYGSSQEDDTIAVDESSNYFMELNHHKFVAVHFRDASERDNFDAAMCNLEYDYILWS